MLPTAGVGRMRATGTPGPSSAGSGRTTRARTTHAEYSTRSAHSAIPATPRSDRRPPHARSASAARTAPVPAAIAARRQAWPRRSVKARHGRADGKFAPPRIPDTAQRARFRHAAPRLDGVARALSRGIGQRVVPAGPARVRRNHGSILSIRTWHRLVTFFSKATIPRSARAITSPARRSPRRRSPPPAPRPPPSATAASPRSRAAPA